MGILPNGLGNLRLSPARKHTAEGGSEDAETATGHGLRICSFHGRPQAM